MPEGRGVAKITCLVSMPNPMIGIVATRVISESSCGTYVILTPGAQESDPPTAPPGTVAWDSRDSGDAPEEPQNEATAPDILTKPAQGAETSRISSHTFCCTPAAIVIPQQPSFLPQQSFLLPEQLFYLRILLFYPRSLLFYPRCSVVVEGLCALRCSRRMACVSFPYGHQRPRRLAMEQYTQR